MPPTPIYRGGPGAQLDAADVRLRLQELELGLGQVAYAVNCLALAVKISGSVNPEEDLVKDAIKRSQDALNMMFARWDIENAKDSKRAD